jgi:hypothetical protein
MEGKKEPLNRWRHSQIEEERSAEVQTTMKGKNHNMFLKTTGRQGTQESSRFLIPPLTSRSHNVLLNLTDSIESSKHTAKAKSGSKDGAINELSRATLPTRKQL